LKKRVLVKQVLRTDSVKQDLATGVMVNTLEEARPNPMTEKALTGDRTETNSKMHPIDEFRYSGRCFCGNY